MKTPRIDIITEPFEIPQGALGLGENGWLPDQKEHLSIMTTADLDVVLGRVAVEYESLLGQGQLVFATEKREGQATHDPNGIPCTAYQGYLYFQSDEDTANKAQLNLPEGTPKHISDFLSEHWEDFRKVAMASDPDSVLVAWTGQTNFSVQAVPRAHLIETEPDTVPPEAKAGPLTPDPGAECAMWASICTAIPDKDEFQVAWCSLNFYPQTQA